jgi:hypothetical protein
MFTMPRQARIDAPGALHHIIIRGIDRTTIFKDDKNRENFLERLSRHLSESQTPCYACALLRGKSGQVLIIDQVDMLEVIRGHALFYELFLAKTAKCT